MTDIKAYTVKFSYTVDEIAHIAIAAEDEDQAKAGAEDMLGKYGKSYKNAEILSVSEVSEPTDTEVTLN